MRIVVLTGAGISAESGLATFRGPDGLWEGHRVEDVATPEAFERDPALVHEFYNQRRAKAALAQPNPAHLALATLARRHDLTLVTQNVDDLHERAGSRHVIHMHGALNRATCTVCRWDWEAPAVMHTTDHCPHCGSRATRPNIVWFGEIPHHMREIWDALDQADLFAAIGTSGQVYPAAGFAQHAARMGTRCVELNLAVSANSGDFAERIIGPASQTVPQWVNSLG
ncbi:MAG: NAD-dependent deacylase [Paracoccus sp. (in: a-proteobacteria)]|nr:NAD-dependent deacylase [Paracoccus sp. (in: a-proteobacteria)]